MTSIFDIISSLAMTFSVIIGLGSIIWGVKSYKLNIRDSKIRALKESIIFAKSQGTYINRVINYDLLYDLIYETIKSPSLENYLLQTYNSFFNKSESDKPQIDLLDKHLKKFPAIFCSLNSNLITNIENSTLLMERETNKIMFDFPVVARALTIQKDITYKGYESYKAYARDESSWKEKIKYIFERRYDDITDFNTFITILQETVIYPAYNNLTKELQKAIDYTTQFVEIITDHYMSISTRNLIEISNAEIGSKILSYSKTKSYTDDMREIERCLNTILSGNELIKLRELSTKYEVRNKKDDNESN